jgi:hypothetical protein
LAAEEIRMNRPIARASVAAALLAVVLAACSDSSSPAPTPISTTETFTGTLLPLQKAIHPYTVKAAGSVTTTLSALSGAATIAMVVGTWDGTTCTVGGRAENVMTGGFFLTDVPSPQNMCTLVYDVGSIGTSATYTVTVIHP